MSSYTMRDILYGRIVVPGEYEPFLRIPEFLRLRGVRLSNLDSVEFKDLSGPTRWEHAIGVLHLADICSKERALSGRDRAHLLLAALLHDIATPPFAHTAEYVLQDFDHERETSNLLAGAPSRDVAPSAAIYLSESPQFEAQCERLSKRLKVRIDVEEVARMVLGEGELGFLISGSVDLDNADNVTRASLHMGYPVDPRLPERLAKYLATCVGAPVNLHEHENPDVRAWVEYRARMYGAFFDVGLVERGREAFLQHLFRRAVSAGVRRHHLIWNTDEGFLSTLESVPSEGRWCMELRELVRRYRLLETPRQLLSMPILDQDVMAALSSPMAVAWIEEQLSSEHWEPIVTVARSRYVKDNSTEGRLLNSRGEVRVFKLGHGLSHGALPNWLRNSVPSNVSGKQLERAVAGQIASRIDQWAAERPWLQPSKQRRDQALLNLSQLGDWSFRASKNKPLHTYPSTFVQAIPGTLIHSLGVGGELIIDPFGGTGNTAYEAVRSGGFGLSIDSNSIASLISKVRLTYLDAHNQRQLRDLGKDSLEQAPLASPPDFANLDRWHHRETLQQLQRLRGFVESQPNGEVRNFLMLAFSAILPETTGRKGQQHGFFADNTPLPRGMLAPTFVDAYDLFLSRVDRMLYIIERSYAQLERGGEDPLEALQRARVLQADARLSTPSTLGVAPSSASAVITSPPYLCMADYTLGHRLSYGWLGLDMQSDFTQEIGPRRARLSGRPQEALNKYLHDMEQFARLSWQLLIPEGYLALILAAPTAKAFADFDVLNRIDALLVTNGFAPLWSTWRDISWSRNHGYSRLRRERISIHRRLD